MKRLGDELAGVLPVLATPFTADDALDEECLTREIDWVFEHGADGVTIGMVSEILRLSDEERLRLTERVCTASRGKLTVVSVGAETTVQAVQFARHAEAAGASAVMAAPPLLGGLSEEAMEEYFDAVIENTSLPVVVQDASGYVGAPLSLTLQARLLRRHGEERVYFKPEAPPVGPQLSALRAATNGQARVFDGSGGIGVVDAYRRGIVGTMPGSEVCWALVALWRALERGDDSEVYDIAGPLALLVSLQTSLDAFVAVEKYLLHDQGIFESARQRGPVGFVLDDETRDEVQRLVRMLRDATSPTRARQSAASRA